MLKVIEFFAGIGSQTQALKNIGIPHKVVGISEIDKYAIQSYEAIHGSVNNFGDISKIKSLPYADLWTYSFPCFVAGTKVLTMEGFKNIETIKKDDLVLTHKNRYKKVVKPMINKTDHIYKLSTMCSDDIYVTEEHPFYVRKKYIEWDSKLKKRLRKFKQPKWVKAKELSKEYYVGVAINQKKEIPKWDGVTFKWNDGRKDRYSNILKDKLHMNEFWWLIGRYIGDGWLRKQNGIIICSNFKATHEIEECLKKLQINYNKVKERTVDKIHIPIKEIGVYCEQFGKGAKNKKLTKDIFNLQKKLLKSFIKGYMSADGCVINGLNKATSISNDLIYGLGQCVAKAYNRPFSIYKTKRPKKCTIEGRIVNQNDTYSISWKNEPKKQDKAFFEDDYIWFPINNLKKQEYNGLVYNFEVEEDNSYVAQNIIVHNCQDISVSGNQKGFSRESGTRSGLLWEIERLLNISEKPKYLLMENVKNLVSKQFMSDFKEWIIQLDKLGYKSYYDILNAKDYGIPQNRERVFMVSIRKDINQKFVFPKKQKLKLRLKDMLEDKVDDKYYLCDKTIKYFNKHKEIHKKRGNGFKFEPIENAECISKSVTTKAGSRATDNYIKEPVICASRGRNSENPNSKKSGEPTQQRIEVNSQGISNTLTTVQKDNLVLEQLGYINSNSQGQRAYNDNISVTLGANGDGMGAKTGLYHTDHRIRKLTPLECYRLMGFTDEQFNKAESSGVSDTQLYRQAGNSIVVNVLEAIFKELFITKTQPLTLF